MPIIDQRQIRISDSAQKVFTLIETMPNKFPVFKILESRLLFSLRMAMVGGIKTAIKMSKNNDFHKAITSNQIKPLRLGDSLGPFKLTEIEKSKKYFFTFKSFFLHCKTGYTLRENHNDTILSFDIIAENPRIRERIWWFFIKPIHYIMAKKVLKSIKRKVEYDEK